MMMRLVAIFFLGLAMLSPVGVGAQSELGRQISGQVNASAEKAEVDPNAGDPQSLAVNLVRIGLGLVGMFFMVLVVIAGFWWATARGDESKVEKAQKTIRAAIGGLIIVMAAWSITYFVGRTAQEAVNEQGEFNRAPQGATFDDIF